MGMCGRRAGACPARRPHIPINPLVLTSLLAYGGGSELAHETIERRRLLILDVIAALVENTYFDALVDTFESLTGLARRQDTLTSPDSDNRDLQAGERLVYIGGQIVAQEGGHWITGVRLVRTGVDVLYQVIGDQAKIVIALLVVVTTNGPAGREKIVDKLADDGQTQDSLPGIIEGAGIGLLQHHWRGRNQHQACEQLRATIGIGDDI